MTENWAYCGFQGWLQTEKTWPTENRAHALLLVILHGKSISFGFVISTLSIKMNLKWNLKMN